MIVRFEGRLLHFTTLFNVRFGWLSVCCTSADFTHTQINLGQRAHLDTTFDLDVVEVVYDHLVRRDGGVRFGNCLFGHLEGFVGGEGLDGVAGLDGVD